MPLALKARFYAIAIPLVTTTGVVSSPQKEKQEKPIQVLGSLNE
jgi:hypothetical protein